LRSHRTGPPSPPTVAQMPFKPGSVPADPVRQRQREEIAAWLGLADGARLGTGGGQGSAGS
jgi:hypothetical protein